MYNPNYLQELRKENRRLKKSAIILAIATAAMIAAVCVMAIEMGRRPVVVHNLQEACVVDGHSEHVSQE